MKTFKILTIAFLIFIFNVKAFALDANYKNALKEIDVQKSAQKGYLINLIFENAYKEPLALKKKTPGEYTILLPETKLSSDNVSVLYEAAKNLIDFEIVQNAYLDKNLNNGYVKIIVRAKNSVPLSVASGVAIKTNLEKIKKEDIATIIPKTAAQEKSQTAIETEAQNAEENDIAENPTTASLPADKTVTQIKQPEHKTTIITKIKNKIENKTKLAIKKAKKIRQHISFKKLLKFGIIAFVMFGVLDQIIKVKNSFKKATQSKFNASSGVLKRDTKRKQTPDGEDDSEEDSPHVTYTANTFGKMSQRSSYKDSMPQSALDRISSSQNIAAQTNNLEPSAIQNQVVKNQSNPFVTSAIEKEGNVIKQEFAQAQTLTSQAVEEEEIVEEAPNPDYPDLVSQVRISKNKGLYLINYDNEYSLLGYINDKIFVIKKFETVNNKKLQVRVNAKTEKSTTYIVRLDNYKALIDVSASNMKTLIEF